MFFSILLTLLLADAANLLNVFDETPTCRFTSRNTTYTISGRPVAIKKYGFHVIFSPCVPIKQVKGCARDALVCMLGRDVVSNAGTAFDLVDDVDAVGEKMLRSRGGIVCRRDPGKKFETRVHFEKKSSIEPTFSYDDDCILHINIMHPTYEPPCTKRINGYLLDMRRLSGEVQVPTKFGRVALNLCGVAPSCNDDRASSCTIRDNRAEVIGTFDSHTINYDSKTGLVEITYKIGSQRKRRNVKVSVRCNWNALRANLTYLEPPTQGRNYQFSVESYLGCVKMPMDCYVKSVDNFWYNLTGLYKPEGWKVANVANGELVLNMCGPLKSSEFCAANFSQICHRTESRNYGSILSNLQVEDAVVSATFSDGSTCPKNASVTLSTNLKFKCSFAERGPVLKTTDNCRYDVWWETPKACPYYTADGKGLQIVDNLGDRNLHELCAAGDREHRIHSNSSLRFNFCHGLATKCGTYSSNVSVCLHDKGKEFVIGFTNANINSFNGMLSMHLYGENCPQAKEKRSLVLNFKCDYGASTIGDVDTVKVIRDLCTYDITIALPAVCPSRTTQTNCAVSNKTHRFNLMNLSRTKENYIVNVGDLTYSINVCRPVVVTSEATCRADTAVCLRNGSEPNIKSRFSTLGYVNARGNLKVVNGSLRLHYQHGKLCENGDDASTLIHFSCGENIGSPAFLRKTGCVFEFAWSSKHACPRKIKVPRSTSECVLRDDNGTVLNLSNTVVRTFYVLSGDYKYLFDICRSNYTGFDKNDVPLEIPANVILDSKSLEFQLNNTCDGSDGYNKVHVRFVCGDTEEFNMEGKNNCTVNFKYSTNIFCNEITKPNSDDALKDQPSSTFPKAKEMTKEIFDNLNQLVDALKDRPSENLQQAKEIPKESFDNLNQFDVKSPIEAKEKPDQHDRLKHLSYELHPTISTTNVQLEEFVRCTIKHGSLEIKLNDVELFTMSSLENDAKYTIGVNKSSDCPGYICKDGEQIATLVKCPEVEFDGAVMKAIFPFDGEIDHSYAVEVLFSCKAHGEPPAILKETEHTLQFSYPLEDICSIEAESSNVGMVVGISVGVILLLVLIIVVVFKRHVLCTKYSNIRGNKNSVYVYCKDTDC